MGQVPVWKSWPAHLQGEKEAVKGLASDLDDVINESNEREPISTGVVYHAVLLVLIKVICACATTPKRKQKRRLRR